MREMREMGEGQAMGAMEAAGSTDSTGALDDVDCEGLWADGPSAGDGYTEPAPSEKLIAEIESELGVRLPSAYVELARRRNGGHVRRSCHPVDEPTGWADDHIMITGIYAIGRTVDQSLLGPLGSTFMRDEWGYPAWGVGIGDTPSAGHEQPMLDYRECGPQGEPSVVHVDQERDYRVTFVAPDFASFIRGLVSDAP
ncbi:SMI1/KNR4 family protein [Delftia tsuruhatensis]|uniref:SMI1/KNR4 family protein n=1 Tax=Delftia tsuruhatensis TaxID=180282 RepID=UPI001F21F2B3|nr:SMI1/KNR4 family protein [Delftia tsuruhatensis]